MISSIASNLQNSPKPLVLTPTRLEDNLKKNKYNLAIFKELKEGDKLGKEIKDDALQYYKVSHYTGIQFSRCWHGERRMKTVDYLENES